METWIPAAKVVEAVNAILMRGGTATAESQYAEICSEALRLAQEDLIRILTIKGYTASQIESWSSRGRYVLDQAIFWSLTRATGLGDYTNTNIKQYDRREELERAPAILIGGESVAPGGAAGGGGISSGRLSGWRRYGRRFDAFN